MPLPRDRPTALFPSRAARLGLHLALCTRLFTHLTQGQAITPQAAPLQLHRLADVASLSLERARTEHPTAAVEGITAFATRRPGEMFVVDADAGVVVLHTNTLPSRAPGQRVRISGTVEAGLLAPFINAAHVEVLGPAPMPPPLDVPLSRLHEGDFVARWVRVSGFVRDVVQEGDFYLLVLRSEGVRMPIIVMGATEKRVPVEWIDRPAMVHGISWPEVDREGKHIGTWIHVPDTSFLHVDATPQPDPFTAPSLPIGTTALLRQLSDRRLKITGTVLYQTPSGRIYLRDATGAAEAQPLSPLRRPSVWARLPPRPTPPRLQPGDLIELIGSPTATQTAPSLMDAEFRRLGQGAIPPPIVLTSNATLTDSHDGELVRLRAKVFGHDSRTVQRIRQDLIELDRDGTLLQAILETESASSLPRIPEHTLVEITGICASLARGTSTHRQFRVILRHASDLRILGSAPWWSSLRPGHVLLVSVGFGALAAFWIGALRRQIRRREDVESAVRTVNADLERRIHDRTTELVEANAQLHCRIADTDRAEKVQKALFEISEAVHAAADLPSLYARIHATIGTLMRADNFYLALLDEQTGLVSFPYFKDLVDPPPAPRMGRHGMTEYVLRSGRPTLANLTEIQRLKDAGEYTQSGHPSAIWLGVPLTVEGRTFGVMAVQDQDDPRAFGEEDKRILTFVADQTALAIWRKRQEEELRASTHRLQESEQRFGKAFRSTPAVLSIARLSDERIIEVNEAFLATSGYSRSEVLGQTTAELRLWADPAERTTFLRRVEQHGVVRSFEARLQTKHGHEEVVLMSAERIELNGEPCLLALSLVVTARKRAEEELLRSLAQERELSELKSRFVSMVSHEFRTPLGIILSSAEILENYLDRLSPTHRREHLRDISQCSRQMAGLMEEVLVLGRAEAGKLEFKPAPLDLVALTRRIVSEIHSASNQRCPIRVEVHAPLPEAHSDAGLLRHILTNLITNAVKYSPPGHPVDVSLRQLQANAILAVRDRGIGIPDSDVRQMFQAFHRGRNVGDTPGSGLGLMIVKRCVELHQGHVYFETHEDAGTTFTVSLPVFAPHS